MVHVRFGYQRYFVISIGAGIEFSKVFFTFFFVSELQFMQRLSLSIEPPSSFFLERRSFILHKCVILLLLLLLAKY
jgi:hypothetical protein